MRIIYVSSLCSDSKFSELFDMCKTKPVQQGQKYTKLLITGFVANEVDVSVVSAYPITRVNTDKLVIRKSKEEYDKVQYTYLTFINMIVIKHLMLFSQTILELAKLFRNNRNTVVIVDGLNTSIALAAVFISKIYRKKIICTVTDIPTHMHNMNPQKGYKGVLYFIIECLFKIVSRNSDAFILTTKYMNDELVRKKQKSIVVEGVVDPMMAQTDNKLCEKHIQRVCIYAGALNEIYGVKTLAKAFIRANIKDSELHFYGAGDCTDYLINLAEKNCNIKYYGMIKNELVVAAQLKATLLINPRPTHSVYTKYSFPSKNMEYMASGTPILTTKLAGMSEEYLEYVYLIKDETIEGIADEISFILSKPIEELYDKGKRAKDFVMKEKNGVVQARKVLNVIEELL